MNCTEVRQHAWAYLDGEVGGELSCRLREHLAGCPECATWLTREERLEQTLTGCLASGAETPELWGRVLSRAGVIAPRGSRRRLLAGMLAAAGVLLALGGVWLIGRGWAPDLARDAANWHERCLRGEVRPDLISVSDEEVDRYLKTRVPFRVHCPPRTDVHFAVRGAGVCFLDAHQQAAYIVGRVDQAQVSILVLDRHSLDAFPRERAYFEGGGRHRCREGDFQMVSGVVADNVVVVIGSAPAEALEKLLNAYGTYPDS